MFDICKKKNKEKKLIPNNKDEKLIPKEDKKPKPKPVKKILKPKEKKVPLNKRPGWEFCELFTPAKVCYCCVFFVVILSLLLIPIIIRALSINISLTNIYTPPPFIPGNLWEVCCISEVDGFKYNCNYNRQNTDVFCDVGDSKYVFLLCLQYGTDACAVSMNGISLAIRYRYKSYFLNMVASPNSYLIIMRNAVTGGVFFQKDLTAYSRSMFYAQNFWIGLNTMYNLTNQNLCRASLKILINSTLSAFFTASYSTFRVGPSSGNYVLDIRGFSSNSSSLDALSSPSDAANSAHAMPFTGYVAPLAGVISTCSKKSGWWWNVCSSSALTADDGMDGWEYSATSTDISYALMAIQFTAQ